MDNIKSMSITKIMAQSYDYVITNFVQFIIFSMVHIVFSIIGLVFLGGFGDVLFLPWVLVYYLYWCFFYRFYFNKKPYVFSKNIFDSFVPSTKILAIAFVVLTGLLVLPMIPPFFAKDGAEWAYKYMYYLNLFMEDTKVLDIITMFILVFVFPFIVYRPMMAWIASLLGRSGLMRSAYFKTRGNYWKMVLLGAWFVLIMAFLKFVGEFVGVDDGLVIVVGSFFTVYLNVILAKMYEYFFLDIDV